MQKVDENGLQGSIKSLLEDDVSIISVLETRPKTVFLVNINTPSPECLNKLSLAWFCYKQLFFLASFQMEKFPFKLHWANTQDGPSTMTC